MRRLFPLLVGLLLWPAMAFAQSPQPAAPETTGADTTAQQAATSPDQLSPPRSVIELFTSQGCSDCPAADALLKQYLDRKNIVALSLPVDYWDYLGWKDTLASDRNGERQREYAKRLDIGTVYTPQAVVNGASEVLGSSQSEIDRAISATETATAGSRVPVHFWFYGTSIVIEVGGAAPGAQPKDATIWLAVVQKSVEVPVKAGENKGKTLTYYNVVREMTPVGLWNGRPATIRLSRDAIMRPETEDLIVLVQEASTGPIIGSARMGD